MTMLATDRPATAVSTAERSRRRTLARSALITTAFVAPAMVVHPGLHPDPVFALVIFGAAVVSASFC